MATATSEQLQQKQCKPCEGGVEACSLPDAQDQLQELQGWELSDDGQRIGKTWKRADFMSGVRFLNAVADLAEEEGHHPDVTIKNYKEVVIELTTHAIGGLSENDFILAAKIDRVAEKVD